MKILIVSPRRTIFSKKTDIGTEGNNIVITIHNCARDKDAVMEWMRVFGYKQLSHEYFEDGNVHVYVLRRKK